MKKVSFTFWRDGKYYLGFLNQYPDYQTQATTKSELTENLTELLKDIESREVPYIRSCMSPAGSQLKACFGHLRSDSHGTRLSLHASAVGWVERSDTHHGRMQGRWVSLRSTHPTTRFPGRQEINRVP